jgi:hypothetical protein
MQFGLKLGSTNTNYTDDMLSFMVTLKRIHFIILAGFLIKYIINNL